MTIDNIHLIHTYLNKAVGYGSINPAAQAILQWHSPFWRRRSRCQMSNEEPPRENIGRY